MKWFSIIFLFLYTVLSAQDVDSSKFHFIPKKPLVNAGKDFSGIFTQPFKNKKKSLITLGALGVSTIALYQFDDEIQRWSQANKNHFFSELSEEFTEPLGGGEYSMMLLGGIGLTGLVLKNERWIETAYLGVESFIYAGILSRVPKILFGRQRPYVNNIALKNVFEGPSLGVSASDWVDQWKSNRNASYISGHTTTAFAVATVFAEQSIKYGRNKWVPYVAYGLAGLCSYSRIYDNKHWATDVLGGALFGHLIGRYLVRNHHWQINPYRSTDSQGLSFSRTF